MRSVKRKIARKTPHRKDGMDGRPFGSFVRFLTKGRPSIP